MDRILVSNNKKVYHGNLIIRQELPKKIPRLVIL